MRIKQKRYNQDQQEGAAHQQVSRNPCGSGIERNAYARLTSLAQHPARVQPRSAVQRATDQSASHLHACSPRPAHNMLHTKVCRQSTDLWLRLWRRARLHSLSARDRAYRRRCLLWLRRRLLQLLQHSGRAGARAGVSSGARLDEGRHGLRAVIWDPARPTHGMAWICSISLRKPDELCVQLDGVVSARSQCLACSLPRQSTHANLLD